MLIITDYNTDFHSELPVAASLGFFDGLHLGHMAIIGATRNLNMKRAVITFANSPAEYITHSAVSLIISEEEKRRLLEKEGIDYYIVLEFDQKFMQLSKYDFFEKILLHFGIKKAVAGFNFTFGRNKEGNAAELIKLAKIYNIDAEIISEIKLDGETVSSTAIREAINCGDYKKAEAMLGRSLKI